MPLKKTNRGIKRCAWMMAEMLKLGFKKSDLPALEKLYWQVRDKNGNLKNQSHAPNNR